MILRPWPGIWLSILALVDRAHTQIPSPNLALGGLGQVAVGGSFDAISLYTYEGQMEGLQGNGTQSILQRLPNGMFDVLAATDANIEDMCTFTLQDGTFLGVVVGGNFTSIGGIGAQSVAFIDGETGEITPHPGIQGAVNALLCDNETETVYVGGAFDAVDSSNAIAWLSSGSWSNLPFAGFDAPVTSITRAPNGHIVFGGAFTGLKNMTAGLNREEQGQLINLDSATISSVANTTTGANIVCPSNDSTATPWTLKHNTPGSWTASLRYGFEPSRIRLWNNLEGPGVKTWRFTALPNTGIMNFTFTDPVTGDDVFCDATCPLAQNSSLPYQDFYFVNRIGMNSFRLDVSAWYGQGGALKGVELFQNDTFVYAIEALTPKSCLDATGTLPQVTTTGPWYETPSRNSVADYLTVVVGPTTLDTTSIVFEPNIREKGNYTVMIYTPGCIQDSSCSARGSVNVTGTLTSTGGQSFSTQLSQTNDYEKYEQVYQGPIDPASGNFRPAVTILPSKELPAQLIVASRVRFSGNPSTGGLNGLFDFDPNVAVVDLDFSQSAINNAGTMLQPNAQISALAMHEDTIYAAGSFADDSFTNIMSFANNKAQSLPNGGLNAAVTDIYSSDDFLYVGGNFTGTTKNGPSGLQNVASYSYADDRWVALGAGLDGPVMDIVPFQLNITSDQVETVIGVSGVFQTILATSDDPQWPVDGFAVWVPSRSNWLQNLGSERQLLGGSLCSYTTLPNNTWLGAGTLVSLGQAISGIAGLAPAGDSVEIRQLPIDIESSTPPSTSSLSKRGFLHSQNISGIVTGTYDTSGDRNITILGGHFAARTNSSTVQNLLFLDGDNGEVTGLPTGIDDNSTFVALATQNDILFAGGMVTGRIGSDPVRGLLLYDLANSTFRTPQPAALNGEDVIVNAFATQPGTSNVYVGGSFDSTAQGLACAAVCIYDTSTNLWIAAGGGVTGSVTALHFIGDDRLVAAGNLSVSGNQTSLAQYDTELQSWSVYETAQLPGPVTAFAPTSEDDEFWVAGTSTGNNSAYLVKVVAGNLMPVMDLFDGGTDILGMQLMALSRSHRSSRYFDNNVDLLVMGQLNITGFGRASAALFNGTTLTPFLLTVDSTGESGSIRTLFSQYRNTAINPSEYMFFLVRQDTNLSRNVSPFERDRRPRCVLRGAGHRLLNHCGRHDLEPNPEEAGRVQHGSERGVPGQEREHQSSAA